MELSRSSLVIDGRCFKKCLWSWLGEITKETTSLAICVSQIRRNSTHGNKNVGHREHPVAAQWDRSNKSHMLDVSVNQCVRCPLELKSTEAYCTRVTLNSDLCGQLLPLTMNSVFFLEMTYWNSRS